MKSTFLVILALLLLIGSTNAQTFQYLKGGGTPKTLNGNSEHVAAMVTDSNRNLYAWNLVGDEQITADTFFMNEAENWNAGTGLSHMLLTSYDCQGNMRWARLIQANYGTNKPFDIAYDGTDGIYISGTLRGNNKIFGFGDTTIPLSYNQNLFLAKYDTNGLYQWVKFIGDNSAASNSGSGTNGSINITADGKIHLLTNLKGGVTLPTGVSITATYDIQFSASGGIGTINVWSVDSSFILDNSSVDEHDEFYASFYQNVAPYGILVGHFSNDGLPVWATNFPATYYMTCPFPDGIGHSYAIGYGSHDSGFHYNGISLYNSTYPLGDIFTILKLDSTGAIIWHKDILTEGSGGFLAPVVSNFVKIFIAGSCGGHTIFEGDTISTGSSGNDPNFLAVDSAGDKQFFSDLHGNGAYDYVTALTSDNIGNAYMGGEVVDSLLIPGVGFYKALGGSKDFFIVKYGYDCSCLTLPVASFTTTTSGSTATFTYTGVSPYDSLVWDFGDGSATTTTVSPVHTYSGTTGFTACVTVYTSCGSNTYCSNPFAVGINTLSQFPDLIVFPNPATNILHVGGLSTKGTYRLMNTLGQLVGAGSLDIGSNHISIQSLPGGVYLLELSSDGRKETVRVVKE